MNRNAGGPLNVVLQVADFGIAREALAKPSQESYHSSFGRETRQFAYPQDADIVRRVTGLAMKIDKTGARLELRR
jgi:hypothetical protein